jgi:hypothetical protein
VTFSFLVVPLYSSSRVTFSATSCACQQAHTRQRGRRQGGRREAETGGAGEGMRGLPDTPPLTLHAHLGLGGCAGRSLKGVAKTTLAHGAAAILVKEGAMPPPKGPSCRQGGESEHGAGASCTDGHALRRPAASRSKAREAARHSFMKAGSGRQVPTCIWHVLVVVETEEAAGARRAPHAAPHGAASSGSEHSDTRPCASATAHATRHVGCWSACRSPASGHCRTRTQARWPGQAAAVRAAAATSRLTAVPASCFWADGSPGLCWAAVLMSCRCRGSEATAVLYTHPCRQTCCPARRRQTATRTGAALSPGPCRCKRNWCRRGRRWRRRHPGRAFHPSAPLCRRAPQKWVRARVLGAGAESQAPHAGHHTADGEKDKAGAGGGGRGGAARTNECPTFPITIVHCPLVLVRQHVVGLGHLLELLRCFRLALHA